MAAHEPGRPGLHNAGVQFEATEAGGSARIAISGGAVELPGIYAEPLLPLDDFAAQLQWKIDAPTAAEAASKITVQVRDARFANADAKGQLTATWSTGDAAHRFPGRLELDGKVGRARAVRVARYLPLDMPAEVRDYLEHAVRGGMLSDVSFRVNGDLRDFPFDRRPGEFRVAAKVDDVTLAFMPEEPAPPGAARAAAWPALAHVGGELVIDRLALSIRNARALLGGVEWNGVQGGIPNLEHAVLTVDGSGRGPLAEMLRFVNTTPIGGWLGDALTATTATGPAELRLGLTIPLDDPDQSSVKGSLTLAGNDLRLTPDTPLLGATRARVDFTQKGFSVARASARVLGGDVSFGGGMLNDGSLRFSGSGSASAEGLRRAPEFGLLARLASALDGQAAYRFDLGFVHGQPQIDLTSDLVGLAVQLPYPLDKAAATPLELRYQTVVSGASAGAPRDSVRLDLGSIVHAQFERELGAAEPQVLRGGVGVMAPAPQPASGVAANLSLPHLDVDAWQAAIDRLLQPPGRAAARGTSGAAASPPPNAADDVDSPYRPTTIALKVQDLTAGSRRLTRVVAGLTDEAGLWRTNVDSDQLDGYIEYRPTRSGAGRIYARLARLNLPKSEVEQVESLLDQQPASVPALDIVVDDFELRGKHLGRAEVVASNRRSEDGSGREWQLSKLNLTMPEAQFNASGRWAAGGATHPEGTPVPRRADISFKLALNDSGALLDRLGLAKAIRGGKGRLSGDVSWPGSPLSPDFARMVGQIHIAIESGQFLKADPGAARLLSVLSLQSLPRRLSLDFRDLFDRGFAFDDIDGDVQIDHGIASSNNLRMRGISAAVLMEGSADIEHETQDLRVVVVPEINAGTASLAYAVINPALGLGTFLAQLFLRKPLIEAGTREFHISGSWSDPKVERVERTRRPQAVGARPHRLRYPASRRLSRLPTAARHRR